MREQVRGVKWLTPGHIAEKVAEPDPKLGPADRSPAALRWVRPGFSVRFALDGFTQLSLSHPVILQLL